MMLSMVVSCGPGVLMLCLVLLVVVCLPYSASFAVNLNFIQPARPTMLRRCCHVGDPERVFAFEDYPAKNNPRLVVPQIVPFKTRDRFLDAFGKNATEFLSLVDEDRILPDKGPSEPFPASRLIGLRYQSLARLSSHRATRTRNSLRHAKDLIQSANKIAISEYSDPMNGYSRKCPQDLFFCPEDPCLRLLHPISDGSKRFLGTCDIHRQVGWLPDLMQIGNRWVMIVTCHASEIAAGLLKLECAVQALPFFKSVQREIAVVVLMLQEVYESGLKTVNNLIIPLELEVGGIPLLICSVSEAITVRAK
jgi:hypothetical protein